MCFCSTFTLFRHHRAALTGSCTAYLHYDDNMRLWLSQPPHACKTQSDELCSTCPSSPVAKTDRTTLRCPQLSQIPACLASMVHRTLGPTKLPGRLGWRECVSATECSLGTSAVAQGQNQNWFGPLLLPVDLTYVFLTCQHLYKNTSRLHGRKKKKINWLCAILPDASPQHARLSISSMCSTASALPPSVYPDEARCSLSSC